MPCSACAGEAGVLDSALSADATHLVLRSPALLMAVRHGGKERPACVIAPSHPVGATRKGSVCHVDAFERPQTGWTKALRNQYYFTSLMRSVQKRACMSECDAKSAVF